MKKSHSKNRPRIVSVDFFKESRYLIPRRYKDGSGGHVWSRDKDRIDGFAINLWARPEEAEDIAGMIESKLKNNYFSGWVCNGIGWIEADDE